MCECIQLDLYVSARLIILRLLAPCGNGRLGLLLQLIGVSLLSRRYDEHLGSYCITKDTFRAAND